MMGWLKKVMGLLIMNSEYSWLFDMTSPLHSQPSAWLQRLLCHCCICKSNHQQLHANVEALSTDQTHLCRLGAGKYTAAAFA